MKTLFTSDLHLTDKFEDDYRWGIFSFLLETSKKYNVKRIIILGDITEKKNRHSDRLVNRVREQFIRLSKFDIPIDILFGNHDYSDDPNIHFFSSLDDIKNINCIDSPLSVNKELFLPNTKNPGKDWKDLDLTSIKTVYMHQCIIGAKLTNNYTTDIGLNIESIFPKNIKIYSGDIHLPQNIGKRFVYVGAPYSIDYGDQYQGRVIINEEGINDISVYPNFLVKGSYLIRNLEDLESFDFYKGDRAKVAIQLYVSEYSEWPVLRDKVRAYLEGMGVEVKAITMKTLKKEKRPRVNGNIDIKGKGDEFWLERFCIKENLGRKYFDVGKGILDEN